LAGNHYKKFCTAYFISTRQGLSIGVWIVISGWEKNFRFILLRVPPLFQNRPKNFLISNRGMPIPYYHPSKSRAVNAEIYINVITTKAPPIQTQISDWHQLSICARFGRGSLFYIENWKDVPFFDNTAIHPNVPQVRQKKTYGGFWHRNFMRNDGRWKNLTQIFYKALIGGIKTKLRVVADRGVLASYKTDFYYTYIYTFLNKHSNWFKIFYFYICTINYAPAVINKKLN